MFSFSVWVSGCTTSSDPIPAENSSQATKKSADSVDQKSVTADSKTDAPGDMPQAGNAAAAGGTSGETQVAVVDTSKSAETISKNSKPGFWEDYPDIPKPEIMSEVGGIKDPGQRWQGSRRL